MSYLDDAKTYPHREDLFRRSGSSDEELRRQMDRDRSRAIHYAAVEVVCEPCATAPEDHSHTSCVRPCVCPSQRRSQRRPPTSLVSFQGVS